MSKKTAAAPPPAAASTAAPAAQPAKPKRKRITLEQRAERVKKDQEIISRAALKKAAKKPAKR